MDSKQICLWQRVVNFEDVGEVVDNLVSVLKSKLSLLLKATGGVHSNWELLLRAVDVVLALGVCLNILKVLV